MNDGNAIEITGEDVEQAVLKGLEQLGVGPDDVLVEVLEEPARGMFGLGARLARVRLQLLTTAAESPAAADELPTDEAMESEEAGDMPEDALDDAPEDWPGDGAEDDVEEEEQGEAGSEPGFPEPVVLAEGELDEDAEVGRVVLAELLENMALRAEVQVRRAEATDEEEPPWMLDITGESDLSVLIGRKGETLDSLQYITRLVTSRELQRRANIVVDVDGYKLRRMNRLYALARRMADQATSQGRPVAMEPMPPYERRIVHLALREREDVTTESSGEGQARKVNIIPARE